MKKFHFFMFLSNIEKKTYFLNTNLNPDVFKRIMLGAFILKHQAIFFFFFKDRLLIFKYNKLYV